jgi:hypothetical protein
MLLCCGREDAEYLAGAKRVGRRIISPAWHQSSTMTRAASRSTVKEYRISSICSGECC